LLRIINRNSYTPRFHWIDRHNPFVPNSRSATCIHPVFVFPDIDLKRCDTLPESNVLLHHNKAHTFFIVKIQDQASMMLIVISSPVRFRILVVDHRCTIRFISTAEMLRPHRSVKCNILTENAVEYCPEAFKGGNVVFMKLPATVRWHVEQERGSPSDGSQRSEEHTSELQSRENIVCSLLLET